MFKKKPKDADRAGMDAVKLREPKTVEDPIKKEVDATVARAARLQSLAADQQMWAEFARGCKPGRILYEEARYLSFLSNAAEELPARLHTRMDADTALVWRDFALRMAADRERRLKDMLA